MATQGTAIKGGRGDVATDTAETTAGTAGTAGTTTSAAAPTGATHHSLALLDHLARLARRAAEVQRPPDGLRPRHLVALMLLREYGNSTQQGLAEALQLDPSNVVGLLNDLEERGLVSRRRDQADRRRHIVELSAAGRSELEVAEQRLACVEDEMLRALTTEERATLHALLVRAVGDQTRSCVTAAVEDAAAESTY
ncbi:MAG: MarR family transcriptional regulator, transcriptional regulator for hemolysin [Actinomycetota bacterium]|jgi:DNA-binding MarR family transcriptional regulator|nr:MarR family transcriptional regulator, transcriptional regulator for hemolysin [Actinomycetota bacterium]